MTGLKSRVGIITDQLLIRESLSTSIAECSGAFEVALVADSAVGAVETLQEYADSGRPGIEIVLISQALPDRDGIELADQIKERWPRVRAVVLCDDAEAEPVERAIHHGIPGLILTTEPLESLIEVLEGVRAGRRCYRCGLSQEVISNYKRRKPSTRHLETAITPRQIEVLGLICEGKTEREIADVLGISHNTVHVHKNNIMQALQIHSKVGLVKYAAQHNLIKL